jgi:hypothetical protein
MALRGRRDPRKVVGWQLASNMRTTLVLDALRMALGQRLSSQTIASTTAPAMS